MRHFKRESVRFVKQVYWPFSPQIGDDFDGPDGCPCSCVGPPMGVICAICEPPPEPEICHYDGEVYQVSTVTSHESYDASNRQPLPCFSNSFLRLAAKETYSALLVLCEGTHPPPVDSPRKVPVTLTAFPCHHAPSKRTARNYYYNYAFITFCVCRACPWCALY